MTTKEKLRAARCARLAIEAKEERLVRLRSIAERVTTAWDSVGGGDGQEMARAVEEVVDYSRALAVETARLAAVQKKLGQSIDALPRPEHRLVLELYYLNGLPWAGVARRMHYSPRQIQTFHARALAELEAAGL